jgi:hypothetical protein
MAQFQPVNPMRMRRAKPVVLGHGLGHQTPAVRHAHQLALGGKLPGTKKAASHRRRGKKKGHKVKAATTHKRKRKTRTNPAAFVKGSAAARKHMAKLRGMRGKKAAA